MLAMFQNSSWFGKAAILVPVAALAVTLGALALRGGDEAGGTPAAMEVQTAAPASPAAASGAIKTAADTAKTGGQSASTADMAAGDPAMDTDGTSQTGVQPPPQSGQSAQSQDGMKLIAKPVLLLPAIQIDHWQVPAQTPAGVSFKMFAWVRGDVTSVTVKYWNVDGNPGQIQEVHLVKFPEEVNGLQSWSAGVTISKAIIYDYTIVASGPSGSVETQPFAGTFTIS